uniref:Transcription factor bHLH113 n=1 Tax=Anthurium amnicola TaxID=1678845 RepID=A0A1D1Y8T6_9ARAE
MTTQVAEQKRRSDGFLRGEVGSYVGCCAPGGKRLKASCGSGVPAVAGSGSISVKERKDKIGERVAALQQLVSPFGKTDTASVLQEATAYIKFLHDQLEVLSAPYLGSIPTTGELQESDKYSLRSRGLCLMPVECTLGIARSNGADIWAPINTNWA